MSEKGKILEMVRKDPESLQQLSEEFKNDKEIVLAAVRRIGYSLKYASEECKNDRNIVLESMRSEYGRIYHLNWVSTNLKNDKEIVLESVRRNGYSLKYASETLRNDREIVLTAVSRSGLALQYGSEKCRDNATIVYSAVSQNGLSLQHASERWRNNETIVIKAVKQNGNSLQYSSEACRKNRKVVLEAAKCKIGIESLQFADMEIVNDKDFILEVVLHNKKGFSFFGHHLHSKVFKEIGRRRGNIEKSLDELSRSLHKQEIEEILSGKDICFLVSEEILKMKSIRRKLNPNTRDLNEEEEKFHDFKLRNDLKGKEFSDLIFYRPLGSGSFGTTYLCRFNDGIGLFVVKIYHDVNLSSKRVERESLYLDFHRNLVSIIHHSDDETIDLEKLPDYENKWKDMFPPSSTVVGGCGMLIMKFYQQDLRFVMEKKYLRPQEICSIMFQIIQGCNCLHKNMIVHRDLHPGNIFVSEDYRRIWVGDFGCILDLRKNPTGFKVNKEDEMILSVQSGSFPTMNLGGKSAMAPEILLFKKEVHQYLDYSKSDIYSIGLIGNGLLMKYQERSLTFEKTISEMFKIFQKMMEKNPEKRFNFSQSIEKMKRILLK